MREKDSYIYTKNDDKESVPLFLHKHTVLFYLWLQMYQERGVREADEGGQNKWNQGKIIEISFYVSNVVLGTFL